MNCSSNSVNLRQSILSQVALILPTLRSNFTEIFDGYDVVEVTVTVQNNSEISVKYRAMTKDKKIPNNHKILVTISDNQTDYKFYRIHEVQEIDLFLIVFHRLSMLSMQMTC